MNMKQLRPIRRVMLIFPPLYDSRHIETQVYPPAGIASLAAFVRDEVEIKLIDAVVEDPYRRITVSPKIELVGLPYERIIEQVREYHPDLVGISCVYSNQFVSVAELARRIKALDPEIVVATGGAHPSFLAQPSMAAAPLDYIVLGEGELTFRDLIRAHQQGGRVDEIDGLAFRDRGEVRINPRVRWIEDLDSLPYQALDLLPIERYWKINVPALHHYKKRKNLGLYTSRGCLFQCTYCASCLHWGRRYRYRSVASVIGEIRHLREDFGAEEIKFGDDNLIVPRKRAIELFQTMIAEGLTMPWDAPNGVVLWGLDEEMVALMKKSGCYHITLPIESGDQRILTEVMKKPLKLEHTRNAARLARKHGLVSMGYLVLGVPGETRESIANTIKLVKEIKLDYVLPFIFVPLPGSELWQLCVDRGYIPADVDYENVNNYFEYTLKTGDFDPGELEGVSRRLYLTTLFKLPFRNPRWFLDYYSRLLVQRPNFLRTFLMHLLGIG
jgi:anaerobic magnesium-protoporphyrin IX monomethyl ester cyclase